VQVPAGWHDLHVQRSSCDGTLPVGAVGSQEQGVENGCAATSSAPTLYSFGAVGCMADIL
jgi:hypothetical protein